MRTAVTQGTDGIIYLRTSLISHQGRRKYAPKCQRKGLPETAISALWDIHDAIGFRIVCRFIDDVYENIRRLRALSQCTIIEEKDYIRQAKPNGYRSYHIILAVTVPFLM